MKLSDASIELISLVANLEPLAGISLALNLAYLNLQRWRYRQQIRLTAEKGLERLEATRSDDGSIIAALPQLRGLRVLAGENVDSKKLPYFIDVFEAIYGREWDILVGVIFCIFSVTILSIGVAHNIGAWDILRYISGPSFTLGYFYGLLASIACPVASVVLGR